MTDLVHSLEADLLRLYQAASPEEQRVLAAMFTLAAGVELSPDADGDDVVGFMTGLVLGRGKGDLPTAGGAGLRVDLQLSIARIARDLAAHMTATALARDDGGEVAIRGPG